MARRKKQAVVNVYKRITDDVWMLSAKHGNMVESVELYRYVGHPVNDESEAQEASQKWLDAHNVEPLDQPQTVAGKEEPKEEGAMPTATSTPKKPRKAVVKKSNTNSNAKPKRTMSQAHKDALAQGREQSRIINAYLDALETYKPKRGRRRTVETVQEQLDKVKTQLGNGTTGINRLTLIQERRDLEAELDTFDTSDVDIEKAQAEFVKVAKTYSDQRGITYGAWREIGVPADVLKEAGVTRKASE